MRKKTLIIITGLLFFTSLYIYYSYSKNQTSSHTTQITQQEKKPEAPPLKSDTNRYLAHAGGEIDGERYTNSLEALNLNYSLGFRVFEIDIIKTSDNHLVCAHDWGSWKRYTGYKGETPVTLQEFLKYKIKKEYTPLSLEMLHEWFKKHPDAKLLTDKIQSPKAVDSVFKNTHQLMIKLHSFHKIKIAKSLDMEVVLAQNLLDKTGAKTIAMLKELDIEHILISRKFIKPNESLLLELKAAGIKTYASHVNFEPSKDELYVFENEMKFIYGFYADVWDFKN